MKADNEFEDVKAASGFREVEDGPGSVSPLQVDANAPEKTSISSEKKVKIVGDEVKPKVIPPPGTGKRIYDIDPSLLGHREHLDFR